MEEVRESELTDNVVNQCCEEMLQIDAKRH